MASLVLNGNTSGSVTLSSPAVSGTTILTLPTTTDTLVGKTTTDTLTNKTLTSPAIDGTPTGVGVLTSGTAVASTSGTSIDFTSIPSWVKRITVMFDVVSTNSTSAVIVKLGTSGGIVSSGYLSSASFSSTSVGSAQATTGLILTTGGVATNTRTGLMTIVNISGTTWVSNGNGAFTDSAATFYCGGKLALGGTLDRIRITTVNGTDTFDTGSINILYE